MHTAKQTGKKHVALFFALVLLIVSSLNMTVLAGTGMKNGDKYTLTILHTNDIHGNVKNLPKYATVVEQVRSQAKNVLLVDSGDLFLRGEFEKNLGLTETEILNKMNYDYWIPGNNDFRVPSGGTTRQGNKQIQDIIKKASFKGLCANVTMKDSGKYIDNIEPYSVAEINGVKVGIIGITSMKPQDRKWTEVADKVFTAGDETLEKIAPEVAEKSDVVLVLSHAGLAVDLKMSSNKNISAIIGGDDHYKLAEPLHYTYAGEKSTPITQAGGEDFHYLGRLDLTFEYKDGKLVLVDYNGYLYDVEKVHPNKDVELIIEKYREELKTAKAA